MFPFEDVLLGRPVGTAMVSKHSGSTKKPYVFLAKLRSSNRAWAKALAMLVTVARLALMYMVSLAVVVWGFANWLNISSMKLLYKILAGLSNSVRIETT